MDRNPLANAGDTGLIPGLGRSLGEGNGHPLQYSCLENFMDRGAWWARYSPWGCKQLDTIEQLRLSLFHQKIPRALEQLKPMQHNYWTCALEPSSCVYWSPCAWSLCSTTREATAVRSQCPQGRVAPLSATRESLSTSGKTQHNQN